MTQSRPPPPVLDRLDSIQRAGRLIHVFLARLFWQLGALGLVGLSLSGVAIFIGLDTAAAHVDLRRAIEEATTRASTSLRSDQASSPTFEANAKPEVRKRLSLPDAGQIPVILETLQQAATSVGLGWPQADYRFSDPTGGMPPSFEARLKLKGPYPAVRRFVTRALLENPALTLGEFSLSRESAASPVVDARITVVIWLSPAQGKR
jgi:hypothetical protein